MKNIIIATLICSTLIIGGYVSMSVVNRNNQELKQNIHNANTLRNAICQHDAVDTATKNQCQIDYMIAEKAAMYKLITNE